MTGPAAVPACDVLYADLRRRDPVRPAVLVDVREPDEVADVRADGARIHVPFSTVSQHLDQIPRDQPVLVICAAGSRSQAVAAHLLANGWSDVANVAGGMNAWERAGLPVRHGAYGGPEDPDPFT
jgi:rhodanese-related sulfurtransferase